MMHLLKSDTARKSTAMMLALITALGPSSMPAFGAGKPAETAAPSTATPVKHLVVIFQENVSFDHYFGTYPVATNPGGEPKFVGAAGTPTVNGLSNALLNFNPNLNPANGAGASNPFRLDRSQAVTPDQDHDYTAEQLAFDAGVMDLFPLNTSSGGNEVMGYFDGNTVTALWNYAQFFSMSDNSFGTTFGPSTPGVMNLVAGQTNGVAATLNGTGDEVSDGNGGLTVIGDPDPLNDVCSNPTRNQVQMSGKNIGDLLTAAGVTWGGFMGGFNLNRVNPNGTTGCSRSSTGLPGTTADYIPHHSFFNYWASTANPKHTRPASLGEIGHDGAANHQYDLQDFFVAAAAGNLPAVSFLKAQAYQDGHAGYSDPLDEQTFLVNTINFLEALPSWSSTAVVVMYDDSDGWYDHQMGPIVNTSTGTADALTAPGACGNGKIVLPGVTGAPAMGRCGYGPRLPLLVVSPWARQNFVDHTVTDQSSILRFVEDNWLGGERIGQGSFDDLASSIAQMFDFSHQHGDHRLFLNPSSGEPIR
ncbi:MAG TPA: alkaline phosphatase family protein [Dongiaceae bacterium]|nr:alkaline phosphatase family protein [Dongiaceae bacterium]